MSEFKPLVFSGVQPTGNLHLGNYLGAIRKFVALQENNDCIYCVVDLHSLTAQLVHEDLRNQIRSIAAAFIASGIDPKKHIVFNQSAVPQHAELAWIFNCVARIGWMNRMTQFKDKAGKECEQASLGLLAYPSLMAADILVYRGTHVPVGDDQKQHLELARDIAQKFNIDFSDHIRRTGYGVDIKVGDEPVHAYFPMVEPLIGGPAPRVMSLRDGTKKMSKSDLRSVAHQPDGRCRDDLEEDPQGKDRPGCLAERNRWPEGPPGSRQSRRHLRGPADKTKAEVLEEFGGQQFSVFKPALGRSRGHRSCADHRRNAPPDG
jgi:tryptophanyl-tRNA synthetase